MKITAVQLEMAENDKASNLATMEKFVREAHGVGTDLLVFPEMCLCGYNSLFQRDPEGMVIAETTAADDAAISAVVDRKERQGSLAESHMRARRPSLYGKIAEPIEELDTRLAAIRIMSCVPCRLVRQVRKIGGNRSRFPPIWSTRESSSRGSGPIMRIAARFVRNSVSGETIR